VTDVTIDGRNGGIGERQGEGADGRSEVHLRPQGVPLSPAELVSAVAASASSDAAGIAPSGVLLRNLLLVLLAVMGLAAIVLHEWRLGSGAVQGELWDRFRERWPHVRRGRA
jgi:hypothetical protein